MPIRPEVAAVGALSGQPRGTVRLLVGTTADPVLARLRPTDFLAAHPHVGFDVVVSDTVVDTVAAGVDAGIQLGEVNVRLARDGFGLTIVYEDMVRDAVARGERVRVLEAFCEPFPGYYLYDPQRRHASPALRALVDDLRRTRPGLRRGREPDTGPPAGRSAPARAPGARARRGAAQYVVVPGWKVRQLCQNSCDARTATSRPAAPAPLSA